MLDAFLPVSNGAAAHKSDSGTRRTGSRRPAPNRHSSNRRFLKPKRGARRSFPVQSNWIRSGPVLPDGLNRSRLRQTQPDKKWRKLAFALRCAGEPIQY